MVHDDHAICCVRARRIACDDVLLLDCCRHSEPEKAKKEEPEHNPSPMHNFSPMPVPVIFAVLALVGLALFFGSRVEASVPAPGYAPVYVDELTHTYYAPQCIPEDQGALIPTTLSEAQAVGFSMDPQCETSGAFHQEGRSWTRIFMEKAGMLSPRKYWWDRHPHPRS